MLIRIFRVTKQSQFLAIRITNSENGFNSAERLSSAMTCVGAERAARSTIRDNAGHSL
jgi:hypothetical protein